MGEEQPEPLFPPGLFFTLSRGSSGRASPGFRVALRGFRWLLWCSWSRSLLHLEAPPLPHGAAIDVWNEPDGGFFWGRSYAQYFELWKRGVRTARATRPNVTVVGPSIAQFSTSWMQRFLDDCSNSSVLPDVVSWHEWGETGSEIPGDVASVRAMIKGIAQRHPGYSPSISLNEIVPKGLNFRPAVHTTYFANLVRHALLHHEDLCRGAHW